VQIGECRDAQPRIVLSKKAAQHREAEAIRSGMQTLFGDFARMSVPDLDPRQWWSLYPFTVAHMKTHYDGLRLTVAATELVDQPRTLLMDKHEELYQHFRELVAAICGEILLRYTHPSRGFFSLSLTPFDPEPRSRGYLRFDVDFTPPQSRFIQVDRSRRTVFRSGAPTYFDLGTPPDVWNDWDASVFPDALAGGPYPVFVQQHAIDQLEKRMAGYADAHLLHGWASRSLREPVIRRLQGGSYLVEFRVEGRKLGYFVAAWCDGVILVRTFLFLTMSSTPEAQLLWEQCKLKRWDIDYLNLDQWSTFAALSREKDAGLIELFTECGCGDLFLPPLTDMTMAAGRAVAAGIRDYLRLPGLSIPAT
jgi:hypothetical protein